MNAIGGLLLTAAAVATWGCSSGGDATGPHQNGNTGGGNNGGGGGGATAGDSAFLASVSGAVTASLGGPALFDQITDANGVDSAFAFVFGLGTNSGAIVFVRGTPGAPVPGTYTLYPDTATAAPAASDIFGLAILGPTCHSCRPTDLIAETGGSITITQVTATRVVGTFAFSGLAIPASNTNQRLPVTVTGSFDAARGPTLSNNGTSGGGNGCGVTVKCAIVLPPHAMHWR